MAENENQDRGFWAWVGDTLKAAGRMVVDAAKWVADKVVSAAKWVWNSSPVQWIVNTKAVQWCVGVLKTPIGWLVGVLGAMIFAPKVLALLLFGMAIAVLLVWIAGWAIWKRKGEPDLTTDEGMAEFLDADFGEKDSPVTAEETLDQRMEFVREMIGKGKDTGDRELVMEYTARLNVLNVRSGRGGKLQKNAKVTVIHAQTREMCLHRQPDFQWRWGLMYQAALSENRRLREIARLRAAEKKLAKEQVRQDQLDKAAEMGPNTVPATAVAVA